METGKRGVTARGWLLTIVVAILLSVAATWFLGNFFRHGMGHDVGCKMKCCDSD